MRADRTTASGRLGVTIAGLRYLVALVRRVGGEMPEGAPPPPRSLIAAGLVERSSPFDGPSAHRLTDAGKALARKAISMAEQDPVELRRLVAALKAARRREHVTGLEAGVAMDGARGDRLTVAATDGRLIEAVRADATHRAWQRVVGIVADACSVDEARREVAAAAVAAGEDVIAKAHDPAAVEAFRTMAETYVHAIDVITREAAALRTRKPSRRDAPARPSPGAAAHP